MTEQIDEKKFQNRILKLSYALETCEKYKAAQPMFSLHFDELTGLMRDKHGPLKQKGSDCSQMSRETFVTGMGDVGQFMFLGQGRRNDSHEMQMSLPIDQSSAGRPRVGEVMDSRSMPGSNALFKERAQSHEGSRKIGLR